MGDHLYCTLLQEVFAARGGFFCCLASSSAIPSLSKSVPLGNCFLLSLEPAMGQSQKTSASAWLGVLNPHSSMLGIDGSILLYPIVFSSLRLLLITACQKVRRHGLALDPKIIWIKCLRMSLFRALVFKNLLLVPGGEGRIGKEYDPHLLLFPAWRCLLSSFLQTCVPCCLNYLVLVL